LHPFFWHAIRTAKIAAVGDRNPQVGMHSPKRVDKTFSHGYTVQPRDDPTNVDPCQQMAAVVD
jgi:hypothetical protein